MLLIAVALLWLSLPLWPAIRELRRPTDDQPLPVNQGNAADAAEPFVSAHASVAPCISAAADVASLVAELGKRDSAVVVQCPGAFCVDHPMGVNTRSPGHAQVSHLRARTLSVASSCDAELSSPVSITLLAGAELRVAQAPVIVVADLPANVRALAVPPRAAPLPESFSNVEGATWQPLQGWWHTPGEARVRKGERIKGDVLAKRVVVEEGAVVEGSIKASDDLVLYAHARVSGNCVAPRVRVGTGCEIQGCVVADSTALLAHGCSVGTPSSPASVVATDLELCPGARVYGGITAHRAARVAGG